ISKHEESISNNILFIHIPIYVISIHCYRLNARTSEISMQLRDGGVAKIAVMRSVFTHGRWKASHFEIIEANSRSIRII
ncbi:MAG: hypothetical protein LBL41_01290, partial [Bifidobacteriaceae bacterium]|nr:hypothetical protein [Bifidobacteriaceae bacterium]